MRLLGAHVDKLQRHFNQTEGDFKDIVTSTTKITSRAERIEKVELTPPKEEKRLL